MMATDSSGRSAGDTLRQELRRGTLVLAVLAVLRQESYGAAIQVSLADAGVVIEVGALYPMLRRLESQGLLTSTWKQEQARNRRMYKTTVIGNEIMQ